jgi:hypothetical protein
VLIPEVTAIRQSLDPEEICDVLEKRSKWREQARRRWPKINMIHSVDTITEEIVKNLLDFAEFYQNIKGSTR